MAKKKSTEVFEQYIPLMQSQAEEAGVREGYLKGIINGLFLGLYVAFLLGQAYCVERESCPTLFTPTYYWIILPLIIVLFNVLTPKPIRGKFDGKIMLFYTLVIAIGIILIFVIS